MAISCRRLLLLGVASWSLSACDGLSSASSPYQSLVWSEEFNGTTVDPSRWTFEENGDGGGNNELQYYRAANAQIADIPGEAGRGLVITAQKENYGGKAYTSARLNTLGKASWTYGRIEARLKLPEGQGLWPAFWMLGANINQTGVGWPACGEIDIMEMIGGAGTRDQTTYGTLHWGASVAQHQWTQGGNSYTSNAKLSSGFHVYGVEWDAGSVTWTFDGQAFFSQKLSGTAMDCFRKPQFLILNLAVGGNWPGSPDGSTVFPQQYWVDWIRVYQ